MGINLSLTVKLPKSWNELSEKQLGKIAVAIEHFRKFYELYPKESNTAINRLYSRICKILLSSNNFLIQFIALVQIPPEEYADHIAFINKENTRTVFPKAFRIRGKIHFPPANRIQNLSMEEFSFVDALFFNWRLKNDARYLDLICATLYRRAGSKNPDYDIRRPFNKVILEKSIKKWIKVAPEKKLAIAYTFEGCRNEMVKLYPNIFPKPPKETKKTKIQQNPQYTPFGQLLNFKINFDPSKLEQTERINMHKFLSTYENELINEKKTKKNAGTNPQNRR
ncbi:hypothetical protein [Zunongwangia atlantica]|uniref:Uncharacterized protein n=1 Tax=Zunongwangia atlantica 22II14-10F7 TaxID=1185767 RepID=A0A1Y1SYB2_9FLAO|nr:hypothetical protein [Zunongwangia atlantica]ORL43766.1 hypothetical protein IIF7_18979 [Zunongwangia atlantica 22II14-10F7]